MHTVKDLVKLLDLEIGEEFHILDSQETKICDHIYKFTVDDLYWYDEVHYLWKSSVRDILGFFTGEYTIIKEPWKPKNGDIYYYITISNDIGCSEWHEDSFDLTSYAAKNCFKTEEEAEKHKDEVIANLKSIYEKGNKP